jgi:hypothetical protein
MVQAKKERKKATCTDFRPLYQFMDVTLIATTATATSATAATTATSAVSATAAA